MKLYLTHSSGYDYKTELYTPLVQAFGEEHDIFLPHAHHNEGVKSKDIIPTCDVILAEVSYPSTGQGIELGWADASNRPIICFYKSSAKVSGSLRFISDIHIEYTSTEDMTKKLRAAIDRFAK